MLGGARAIVAADVHGVTARLRSLLGPLCGDAIFVSPWDGDGCPYASEQQAHSAFLANHGMASYADKIAAAAGDEPAFIVAFSVGASAAWLHAASGRGHPASRATLFYGSRIRDYADLTPRFDVAAIFAESEASFAPAQLARRIASDRVHACVEAGTAHGFMNPCSPNYAADRCSAQLQKLALALAEFRDRPLSLD